MAPLPCPLLATCAQSSAKPLFYGGILFVGIIDLLIAIIVFLMRRRESRLRELAQTQDIEKGLVANWEHVFGRDVSSQIEFECQEVCLTLPSGKKLLQDISAKFKPGRITAIMYFLSHCCFDIWI